MKGYADIAAPETRAETGAESIPLSLDEIIAESMGVMDCDPERFRCGLLGREEEGEMPRRFWASPLLTILFREKKTIQP